MGVSEDFGLGAVVVPARDGTLSGLGHDVAALGERALGVVIETRSRKCLVHFPEIPLSLWLEKSELADVVARVRAGEAAFANFATLLKTRAPFEAKATAVWLLHDLMKALPVSHMLGLEQGELGKLWDDGEAKLADYTSASAETPARYVGLGVLELRLEEWQRIEKLLGERLLFVRFLPSGMHKLEIAIYLRA